MSGLAILFLLIGCAIGLRLFTWGRFGRAIDTHPVCARCWFDLTGRSMGCASCPECGADLRRPKAIRFGNRRPRPWAVAAGLALAVASAIPTGVMCVAYAARFDVIQLKPFSLLWHGALASDPADRSPDVEELLRRVRAGQLTPEEERTLIATALRFQADLSRDWEPAWGDMLESLHGRGRISTADWRTYLAHNELAQVDVDGGRCIAGSPLRYAVHGEFRGGSPLASARPWTLSTACAIPGIFILPQQSPGPTRGVARKFVLHCEVVLTPRDWEHLRPGEQQLQVAISGVASAAQANPALFAPMAARAKWTCVAPNR